MREFSQTDSDVSYMVLLPATDVAKKARGILEDWLDFYNGIDNDKFANKLWR
ncbi:MAG: hypothetical protein R3241_04985 [Rheinheimera sp.]|nr:hypothetical protein [Rheinheimera sp.]